MCLDKGAYVVGLPEPTFEEQSRVESFDADVAKRNKREEELEQRASRAEAALDALVQGQRTSAPAPVHTPDPELGVPPDPVSNPDQFRAWSIEANRRALAAASRAEQTAVSTEQARQLDALWTEFRTSYSDAAEHPDLVEAAFRRETRGTGQIPGDARAAMARVAAEVRGQVSKIRGDAGRPAAGRTDGVMDGDPGVRGKRLPVEEKKNTFVDQIKSMQAKLPYF